MTSKLSTVSRVEDKKLNFVQRMLTLITAVLLIMGLAYIKSTFFKPQAKYCPDSLSKADLEIINHSQSCSEDDQIFQKNLTVYCLKFKGCIPCPNHGFCSDNGTLSGCKPTYEIKNKICVENEEIANAAHTLLWVSDSNYWLIIGIRKWASEEASTSWLPSRLTQSREQIWVIWGLWEFHNLKILEYVTQIQHIECLVKDGIFPECRFNQTL